MLLGITLTALGLSFMMKSGLGQTAVVAFTQNLALLTGMKSGSFIILFNSSCVLIQLLLQRRELLRLLLQVPESYHVQWLAMLTGILLASYGVAVMMTADLIRHPFEQLVMVLAERWSLPFSVLRSRADMLFIALSLGLILLFHLEFTTLREGTWVSMLLLGRSMALTFPAARKCSPYCWLKEHYPEALN
ncbi:MAG: hypothetical protein HFI29_12920 [Lachnospiraceae bacterium]|nr:hypothetical protein [Lachnospiraceae bacterium]